MIIRLHRSRSRRQTACVVRAAAAEELVDPDPSFRIEKVLHSGLHAQMFTTHSQGCRSPRFAERSHLRTRSLNPAT